MRKQITLILDVPDNLSNERIVELFKNIILVGVADASATSEESPDDDDAFAASEFSVTNFKVDDAPINTKSMGCHVLNYLG